jgi:hypothetical protein
MFCDEQARWIPFKLIGRVLLHLAYRWCEGGRQYGINRRRAINHGVGGGRRFRELGAWVQDLFTAAFLGDRWSSTNRPWDRFEFRRLVNAQLEDRMENAKKKVT